jgi:uncharacterized protein YprB with RNaseH-like and TPR domain
MWDTQQQLARLRARVAAIDQKFTERSSEVRVSASTQQHRLANTFIESWSEGSVISNAAGEHFQTERLYPARKQHGSADIGGLTELPSDLFDILGSRQIPAAPPGRWAFLDTETTGLAAGSGTYAFLIGVGRITADGFRVRQFFMREYAEERSMLLALQAHLEDFDVLVSYNGKSYDLPLLETRYRMNRMQPWITSLPHLDVLHGARRIWKLRIENCRLMQLEEQILGFCREGDIPGELIPYIYFEFVRSREACRVVPVLHHNAIDILSLACLSAIVPAAFRTQNPETLSGLGIRRGEDLVGIARWLASAGEPESALALLRRAVQAGLPDTLLGRTLWDIAALEKKAGNSDAALACLTELATFRNIRQVDALEELAKFYEHKERNYALALDFTLEALSTRPECDRTASLNHRKVRLERRLARPRPARLL